MQTTMYMHQEIASMSPDPSLPVRDCMGLGTILDSTPKVWSEWKHSGKYVGQPNRTISSQSEGNIVTLHLLFTPDLDTITQNRTITDSPLSSHASCAAIPNDMLCVHVLYQPSLE